MTTDTVVRAPRGRTGNEGRHKGNQTSHRYALGEGTSPSCATLKLQASRRVNSSVPWLRVDRTQAHHISHLS